MSYAHHSGHPLDLIVEHLCTPGLKTVMTAKDVNETIGAWSQNVASWMGVYQTPVLFLRYEDLMQTPLVQFRKLVQFLRWDCSDGQIETAISASSFERLRSLEAAGGFNERPATSKSGRTGSWRGVLNENQQRKIVAANAAMMQRFGYLLPNCGHIAMLEASERNHSVSLA